jgi:nucleoside-diphosphate-sugar epimerase
MLCETQALGVAVDEAAGMRSGELMVRGTDVLITGGTGFIGGRLVEKLFVENGARIRVLVRDFSRASRLARFPIRMIRGDITDRKAVEKAVDGCELVFHCAYDFAGDARHRRAVAVRGTENVAEAALQANVARVVHVSTVSVYGTPDGDLDEESRRVETGDLYADTKLEAENLMLRYHRQRGLPVTIVQPTIVYGPFSQAWTLNIVDQLRKGPVALPTDGGGYCNAVYIDDVVHGMTLAALNDDAVGESFLLSSDEPVTWPDFFGHYERILGTQSIVLLPVEELRRPAPLPRRRWSSSTPWREWRRVVSMPDVRVALVATPVVNWPYRMAKRFAPRLWTRLRERYLDQPAISASLTADDGCGQSSEQRPIQQPNPARLALYLAKTRVRIGKARRVLGYQPAFDLERGMALTGQFVDWYYST